MRVRQLAEQYDSLEKREHALRFGVWVFLASELLLFAGLLALYAAYRTMYPRDFVEAAAHDDVTVGTVNTYILITSSFTVASALALVEKGKSKLAGALLVVSILFGAAFLALKFYEYNEHFHDGIYPGIAFTNHELDTFGAHTFFTLYYLLTGLHALHVVAGMVLLTICAVGCFRGRYDQENYLMVEVSGLYWHLVDLVWIFLWPLLYLSH